MKFHKSWAAAALRVFLFSAFLVSAFLNSPLLAQTNTTLSGTVSDPAGAAIAGAAIDVYPASGDSPVAHTSTGADGRFTLAIEAGAYRVRITHEGFEMLEEKIVLGAGVRRDWNPRLALAALSSSVVVSAEAQPIPVENAASPVTILTRQDIEQTQQIWLAPLLSGAPGASIGRTGAMGGITSFFLDGGNSNYTEFLVDGVPVNQPGGDIDLSNYTLDNVEKVEIVHGASSALFGSDALTGVVQILTKRGTTKIPEITMEGDGGTYGTGHGRAQVSGLLGGFDYSAAGGYFSSAGQGVNDFFRDTTLSGNFGYRFSDTDTVRLVVDNISSDAGQPGQTLLLPPNPGQSANLRNFSSGLSWDFQTGPAWHHRVAGTESYIRQIYAEPPFGAVNNVFNTAAFNEQSSYVFGTGGVSMGYDYQVENGSPDGPHVRRNNQGGYVEIRNQFGRRLSVNAGGRADANASYGTSFVPRLGAAYALRFGSGFWGDTRLRSSFGLGIKEPTLVQSFENDPCFPGNPGLLPERSTTLNAGIEQVLASERVRLTVDYFHNDFHNIVSFNGNGAPTDQCPFGTGTFFNTDKARAYGANATIEARPAHWLRISGNYTYDNSRVLAAPNAFDPTLAPGNRLFRRPLNSANVFFNALLWKMNWNLAGYYVGRRTDSDFLGLGYTSNPSYVRWDLASSYNFGLGVSAYGRIENLFDRKYQDAIGYPALGFNFRAGIKYMWGGR